MVRTQPGPEGLGGQAAAPADLRLLSGVSENGGDRRGFDPDSQGQANGPRARSGHRAPPSARRVPWAPDLPPVLVLCRAARWRGHRGDSHEHVAGWPSRSPTGGRPCGRRAGQAARPGAAFVGRAPSPGWGVKPGRSFWAFGARARPGDAEGSGGRGAGAQRGLWPLPGSGGGGASFPAPSRLGQRC